MNTIYPTCGSLALSKQDARLTLVSPARKPSKASLLDEATIYLFGDGVKSDAHGNGGVMAGLDAACVKPLCSKDKVISIVLGIVATVSLFVLSFI